jgi:hypothetical protein
MKVLRFARLLLFCFAAVVTSQAQSTNEFPELVPPYAALPPTLWEQYGLALVLGSLVSVLVVGVLIWVLARPRPVPVLPVEVQARRALAALQTQPQTGAVISQVSQVLRRYISAAFTLPAGELTTQELISAMRSSRTFDAKLRDATSQFLESCDSRKFAPTQTTPPQNAASLAMTLIEQGESIRAAQASTARQSPA